MWADILSEYGENPADYSNPVPDNRLMRFAEKNNRLMLDLLPILQAERDKEIQTRDRNEQYWNSVGNRIVANAILEIS